jgi:DnaK suppressor protein
MHQQMESKEIAQIKNDLVQWLVDFSATSNESIIKFTKSLETSADPVDRASAQTEIDFSFNRLCRNGLNKKNVLNALRKIDDGSYGICEECEEEIPIKRLKAIPDARYCITCQAEMEKAFA